MGKSRRKTKIFGWTCSDSEKRDKVIHHKKMRRRVKDQIQKGEFEEPFPVDNEVSDVYTWDKDGRQFWKDATDRDMGK